MVKKCIYCKTILDESSVLEVCRSCGLKVWGEQMFNAIVKNMEDASSSGDLYQGSVTMNEKEQKIQEVKNPESCFPEEKSSAELIIPSETGDRTIY